MTRSGAAKVRLIQLAAASEPISQPKIAPSRWPERNMSSATPAARTDETAYPVRSSVTTGTRPLARLDGVDEQDGAEPAGEGQHLHHAEPEPAAPAPMSEARHEHAGPSGRRWRRARLPTRCR